MIEKLLLFALALPTVAVWVVGITSAVRDARRKRGVVLVPPFPPPPGGWPDFSEFNKRNRYWTPEQLRSMEQDECGLD